MTSFAERYGPWALICGASDGVGREFAERLASEGLHVALVARRAAALEDVARGIALRLGVQTRVIDLDLATPDAATRLLAASADLEVGFFVYCAGGDPNFQPFLASSVQTAESMIHRNCTVPVQLCHPLGAAMAARGRGAVVILGSGAGFSGARNMAVYSASKAFDMVYAESLWCELKPRGVDVLGLILGETDTPALRRLRFERGLAATVDAPVRGAETPAAVVDDAMTHLTKGPTRLANRSMRWGLRLFYPFSRNFMVSMTAKASEMVMGKDRVP